MSPRPRSPGRPPKAGPAGAPRFAPLPWPADPDPCERYLGTLVSAASRRSQESALRTLARILTGQPDPSRVPWQVLTGLEIDALRAWLWATYKPHTCNRTLSALRSVLRTAWRLKIMPRDDYESARDFPGFKLGRDHTGRRLMGEELARLFAACDDGTPIGFRDAALMAMLYGAALRIGEAVGAQLEDLGPDWLRVTEAKGGTPRITFLPAGSVAALAAWLAVRGDAPGPLLTATDRQKRPTLDRITVQAASNAVRKRGDLAGLAAFTPHDLRRTTITELWERGVDSVTISHHAGHASVATTSLYDRRGDAQQRAAVALLAVPFQKRITHATETRPHLPDL